VWVAVGGRGTLLALRIINHSGNQGKIDLHQCPIKFKDGKPLNE